MAKSKTLIAFEKLASSLDGDIQTHHAADNDSIEVLLVKKAALKKILAKSKAMDAELLRAHEQANKRSIKWSHRLDNLNANQARRGKDIRLHKEFIGRLATQVLNLKHEIENLKQAQSPALANALAVANFKWYELTLHTQQLVRMKQARTRGEETLGMLARMSSAADSEESVCPPLRTSSACLIEILETMLDGVVTGLAQRGWEAGAGERDAQVDGEDAAGEREAGNDAENETSRREVERDGEDAARDRQAEEHAADEAKESVSAIWPTRQPGSVGYAG